MLPDVSGSLAGRDHGVPERFVPAEMSGQLVEAEHVVRYGWAAQHGRDRTILDAGCGVGYGARTLKEAGATRVVGVDSSAAVVEAARAQAPDGVTFEVGDVASLAHPDDAFGLVVCFEVIEHVADGDAVLDELARVLAPGGLLLISSPNRGRYVPGNPHHRYEYTPAELHAALTPRFAHVHMMRQHVMVASVVASADPGRGLAGADVRRLVTPSEDEEIYTLAVAGDGPLPPSAPMVALTHFVELRRWMELYEEQQAIADDQRRLLAEREVLDSQRRSALTLLAEREQQLSAVPDLRERLQDSTARAEAAVARVEVAVSENQQLHDANAQLYRDLLACREALEALKASPSWRVTAPLRGAKRQLRG